MIARKLFKSMSNRIYSRALSTTKSSGYEVNKVAVVGLGSMGHGVAQLCASSGYDVVAVDLSQDVVDHSMKAIEGSLMKLSQKKAAKAGTDGTDEEAEARASLARITTSTDVNAIADCDLVIEAIVENLPIKLDFFKSIGEITRRKYYFSIEYVFFSNYKNGRGKWRRKPGMRYTLLQPGAAYEIS